VLRVTLDPLGGDVPYADACSVLWCSQSRRLQAWFKFQKDVHHHTLALPPVKVKDVKGGAQCIAHAKSFKFIQDLDAKFLPKFRRAIHEVVSNKNFCGRHLSRSAAVVSFVPTGCREAELTQPSTEKELKDDEPLLLQELEHRKFIIFPSSENPCKILVKKLTSVRSVCYAAVCRLISAVPETNSNCCVSDGPRPRLVLR
jgi:hypothetical protein